MKHITEFETLEAFKSIETSLAKPNISKAGDKFPCIASPSSMGGGELLG